MAIKPILFNTEMVRAILDGRKGATRRIVKGFIPDDAVWGYTAFTPKGYISCRGTFADGYGEKIFKLPKNDNSNRKLKHWCTLAGITKNVTFHVARHTAATLNLSLGVPIETVSKLLGHTKISTTQIYAKVIDANKKAAVHKQDGVFD